MKKLLFIFIMCVFLMPSKAYAIDQDVRLDDVKLKVNGKSKIFYSYNIDGYNYYRLTDIAKSLRDSNKNFDIIYDKENDDLYIIRRRNYQSDSLSIYKYYDHAVDSQGRLFIDNREVIIPAVKISGYNYYNIRDIGSILDFGVSFEPIDRTILIDTRFEYTSKGDNNIKSPDFSSLENKEDFIEQFTKSYFDIYDMQTKLISDLMKKGSDNSSLNSLQRLIMSHEKYYKKLEELDYIKKDQQVYQAYKKFMEDYEIQKQQFNSLIEETRSVKYDESQESIYEYNRCVMNLSESFIDLLNKLKNE